MLLLVTSDMTMSLVVAAVLFLLLPSMGDDDTVRWSLGPLDPEEPLEPLEPDRSG